MPNLIKSDDLGPDEDQNVSKLCSWALQQLQDVREYTNGQRLLFAYNEYNLGHPKLQLHNTKLTAQGPRSINVASSCSALNLCAWLNSTCRQWCETP